MQAPTTVLDTLCKWLLGLAAPLLIHSPALAADCKMGIIADLPVTMEGDRLSVPAKVNGKDTHFWLDSGAFFSIMSLAKAKEFGLSLDTLPIGFYITGIGGTATVQITSIKSFVIVGQNVPHLAFLVGGTDPGNGFIGRNILGLMDTEFDLADGSVKLIDPHNCQHTAMNYWAVGNPYFMVPLLPSADTRDHGFKLSVTINGQKIDAMFDTGAETSLLSRSAALRAGINLSGPGVIPTVTGGFGRHFVKGWVVPVAKIAIGDEQILNAHIDVVDDSNSGSHDLPDMLLGEDYMMAHHIYVARRQQMIYFTYSGGKPFRTSREIPHAASTSASASEAPAPFVPPSGTFLVAAVANSAGDPKTADAVGRRGAARFSARDFPGALADLNEAVRQSPGTADYYIERARIYRQMGNTVAARADLDKAITLDSNNGQLLRMRAGERLAAKDRNGALADAEAAARVTPPTSLASAELASFFIRLHQPARAVPMLDAVIAAHDHDAELENLLNARCWARALADIDLDKALTDCNRAIKNDRSPDRLDSRGLVYFQKRNFAAAISDYDAALKIAPRQAWSLYLRGQAKIALGQTDIGKADQAAAQAIRTDIAEEIAGYGIGGTGPKFP